MDDAPERRRGHVSVGGAHEQLVQIVEVLNEREDVVSQRQQHLVVAVLQTIVEEKVAKQLQHDVDVNICNDTSYLCDTCNDIVSSKTLIMYV